jgi:hypothetical protein
MYRGGTVVGGEGQKTEEDQRPERGVGMQKGS